MIPSSLSLRIIRCCVDLPLLDSTVRLDVHDVTDPTSTVRLFCSPDELFDFDFGFDILVLAEVGGQGDHSLLAEIPREGILFCKPSAFRRPRSISVPSSRVLNVRECPHEDQRRDPS